MDMRCSLLWVSLLIAGGASAEVCLENDTNIPKGAFLYQFVPSVQIDTSHPGHPLLTSPTTFDPSFLGPREDACVEYSSSTTPGTPGYLLIYVKPPATSERAYANESIVYVSAEPLSAAASSTLLLAVESKAGDVLSVRSKLDQLAMRRFAMRRVFVINQK